MIRRPSKTDTIFFLLEILTLSFILTGLSPHKEPLISTVEVSPVKLRLFPKVTISGSRVFLADISQCSGNSMRCQEAYGIEVFRFPHSLKSAVLTESKLKELLSKEWPEASFHFYGADQIKLELEAPKFDISLLRTKLLEKLDPITDLNFEIDLEISKFNARDPYVRLEPLGFAAEDLKSPQYVLQNLNGKKMIRWAAYDSYDEPVKNEQNGPIDTIDSEVIFKLKRKAITSSKNLEKGHILEPDDLLESYVPVGALNQKTDDLPFTNQRELLLGKRLRVPVKSGQLIQLSDTEKALTVRRNETIQVTIGKGDLAIGFKGKALKDGSLGEEIEILYPNSKRKVHAKIIGPGEAELMHRNLEVADYTVDLSDPK